MTTLLLTSTSLQHPGRNFPTKRRPTHFTPGRRVPFNVTTLHKTSVSRRPFVNYLKVVRNVNSRSGAPPPRGPPPTRYYRYTLHLHLSFSKFQAVIHSPLFLISFLSLWCAHLSLIYLVNKCFGGSQIVQIDCSPQKLSHEKL